jgi:uncharacterized protein (DUF58 family)
MNAMWFRNIFSRRSSSAAAALFDEAFLRRLERLSLQAQRSLRGAPSGGEHPSQHQLPTTIFSDHRPYSAGDDYRYVDWNAYAHQEQMFVKLGEVEQDVAVHVLLDVSRSMGWGAPSKLRSAQQLVAALGYLALAHNDRLHLAPFGVAPLRSFGPAQGKSRVVDMLRFIEGIQPTEQTALARALRAYATAQGQGGILVLVSDLLAAEGLEDALRVVPPPRWQALVLHILDRRELEPHLSGPLELEDAETGRRLPLTLDAATIAARHPRHADFMALVERFDRRGAFRYAWLERTMVAH